MKKMKNLIMQSSLILVSLLSANSIAMNKDPDEINKDLYNKENIFKFNEKNFPEVDRGDCQNEYNQGLKNIRKIRTEFIDLYTNHQSTLASLRLKKNEFTLNLNKLNKKHDICLEKELKNKINKLK